MSHRLEIRLFGHPELRLQGQLLEPKLPHKALALLYYLALSTQPVGRETLATLLWPDAPAPTAKHSLRNLLSLLHKALGAALEITHRTIALSAAHIQPIDVVVFQQGVAAMHNAQQNAQAPDLALWQTTLDLYHGDFLTGFYIHQSELFEEWTTLRREYLRKQLISNLLALSEAYTASAANEAALACLDRLLEIDPQNEAAYVQQIQLLLSLGRRTEGWQRYEQYRQMLANEFNLSPAPALTALLTKLHRQEGNPTTLPPRLQGGSSKQADEAVARMRLSVLPPVGSQPPQPTIPNNLTRPLSAFVGRSQELAYLCRRVADPTCGLLTIVGPGGMGKTSLAQAAAQRILQANQSDFPDGLYFVALSGLELEKNRTQQASIALQGTDSQSSHGLDRSELVVTKNREKNELEEGEQAGALIVTTIAECIGCDLQSGLPAQVQLQNYLRHRRLLLILDNFEQLLSATDTVLSLLTHAPALTMLITSRTRLNVRGETVLALDKLSLPATMPLAAAQANRTQPSQNDPSQNDLEQMSEAIAMFVQRVECLDPHFTLNPATIGPIAQICHLVDGLPLGIELATSMLPMFNCVDLAKELTQSLAFLRAETRDLPADQRTLRAVFERSWRLLAPAEQTLLAKLAIFPATFQIDADKSIVDASPPLLLRLINQSLLSSVADGRYAMHRSVRVFALEKLEQAPVQGEAVRVHFAHFYLNFLAQKEPVIKGAAFTSAITQIYTELDNLRAAWRWGIIYRLSNALLASMHALFLFYELQGLFGEALEQAESGLQQFLSSDEVQNKPAEPQENLLIGRLQTYFGLFNARLGRMAQADAALGASLARLHQADSPFATVLCQTVWGAILRGRDIQQAKILLSEAARQVHTTDDCWLTVTIYLFRGEVDHLLGNYAEAEEQYTKAYLLVQQSGYVWGLANSQRLLGRIQLPLGNYEAAEMYSRNSIAYARQQNLKSIWIEAMIHLAEALRLQGRLDEAQQWYAESRQRAEELHYKILIGQAIWGQGCLAEQCGEYARAHAFFAESMTTGHPNLWAHLPPTLGWALIGLGELEEAQRDFSNVVSAVQTRQFTPITLDAQVGLVYSQELRAQRGNLASQAWVENNRNLLHDIYRHPAATAETRKRIDEVVAKLDLSLFTVLIPERNAVMIVR